MRIEIVCFSERGLLLSNALFHAWDNKEDSLHVTRCSRNGITLQDWTAETFICSDALLFVGAAGIAVRAIAPYIVSKCSDPAVLVMDEAGKHVISLLSGHIGGANALTCYIAKKLGAEAVITTATDTHGVFAVDVWATQNGYCIQNPERIQTVSSKLLSGKNVSLYSVLPIGGSLPRGIKQLDKAESADIVIDYEPIQPSYPSLKITVPVLTLGVGCRRETSHQDIEALFVTICETNHLDPKAFSSVCSINIKENEPGLLTFCQKHGLQLQIYTAQELNELEGYFSSSAFVKKAVGVDNVCERCAVLASNGQLLVPKTIGSGVTMAVALQKKTLQFGDWL